MKRICRWLGVFGLLGFGGLIAADVDAALPTAEQIQILQQMSPADVMQLEQAVKNKQQSAPVKTFLEPVGPPVVIPRDPYASSDVKKGLKPFGYELFAGDPTTFFSASDTPVAVDYEIGPGDVIEVQLFGNTNASYSLLVNRRGSITFPSVGTINVAGMSFDEMRALLKQRVAQQFIGVEASITLGELRAIRVFVLGDVQRPGSYVVNGMSTMTNALFVSGGIKFIGSLRDIQLKRDGKIVSHLDLYDLLLKGNTHNDQRLQPGDVIFVPPVGPTASFEGKVRRPAIYEFGQQKTLGDLIELAGGLRPDAYLDEVRLERINADRQRVLKDLDLTAKPGLKTVVRDGDVIHVYSVLEKLENVVTLTGHVKRPLAYQWTAGLRLSDVIPDENLLLTDADLEYIIVQRQDLTGQGVKLLTASLLAAMKVPGSDDDLLLQPDDKVIVFSLESVTDDAGEAVRQQHETQRQSVLKPLLDQVRELATHDRPAGIVGVGGMVRFPGDYPLNREMRVSDLLRAAGHLRESAYSLGAELTRQQINDSQVRSIKHIDIDLAAILAGQVDADLVLHSYDFLSIREIPQWREQEIIDIQGEVMFPGRYSIRQGETLADILERAGGLTTHAFAKGAVFSRKQLQERERDHLNRMADNLERELAGFGLQQAQMHPEQQQSYHFAQQLVARLRETEAIGRLVINLDEIILRNDKQTGLQVVDGDRLFIPPQRNEVTVIGEVFFPTSHIFKAKQSGKNYIHNSGGYTASADAKRSYVIRANGSVEPLGKGFWSRSAKMEAGDTIVVPLDADRVNPVRLWTDVTQILYQLSIAAASMKTLGVF